MGFRGEALFSLASLSNKLVVATRTAEEELATKLEFLRDGSLDRASVAQIPRKIGTTVAVVRPFHALPARRADMARRIRAERQTLFKLIESCKFYFQSAVVGWRASFPPHSLPHNKLSIS